MNYDSFASLKRAMLSHSCKTKLFQQHDNLSALRIGWECKCGEMFDIGIKALQVPQEMTNEEYRLLGTPEGRVKLGLNLS